MINLLKNQEYSFKLIQNRDTKFRKKDVVIYHKYAQKEHI